MKSRQKVPSLQKIEVSQTDPSIGSAGLKKEVGVMGEGVTA